jgi:hypothetical protein
MGRIWGNDDECSTQKEQHLQRSRSRNLEITYEKVHSSDLQCKEHSHHSDQIKVHDSQSSFNFRKRMNNF